MANANEYDEQEWSALRGLLATVAVDRMRLCNDFEKYLQGFRGRVLARIERMLVNSPAGLKVQVVVEAEYEKVANFRHPREPASEYDECADAMVEDAAPRRKSRRLMVAGERAAAKDRQVEPDEYDMQEPRKVVTFYLRTKFMPVTMGGSASDVADTIIEQLRERHINFIRDGSGLMMRLIRQTEINFASYAPLAGRAYVALPPFLANKKAIVNIHNTDNRCFAYALAAAIENGDSPRNAQRCAHYEATIAEQGLDAVEYPVKCDAQVFEKIEQQIQIPFNVYSYFDDEGRGRYAVYTSRIDADGAIDLLYWAEHYAWIKSFSRFMGDLTKHKGALFYCKRCLGHFQSEDTFTVHKQCCRGSDGCMPIYKMPAKPTTVEFKHTRFEQRCPFVIYADFECLTVPTAAAAQLPTANSDAANTASSAGAAPGQQAKQGTTVYQDHQPISVGMKLISSVPGVLDTQQYETHTSADVVKWFLERLMFYEALCIHYLFDNKRLVMTEDDVRRHEAATCCYVCNGPFREQNQQDGTKKGGLASFSKVRDHDHITGTYRGAAHAKCNLQLRRTYKIPVLFHNFRGYDSHLLVRALGLYKDRELNVIGQTLEKYMTVSWGDHIVFKDSMQFLGSSLDRLTECLRKGGRDKFKYLLDGFAPAKEENINLLLRKGIYPYDYMDSAARLDETALPPIEKFYSRLCNEQCKPKDYAYAKDVWKAFGCTRMLDYHNIYLKTDVLLLACVFESFRTMSLTTYGLDPAHYVSAPHLSWDAMLKHTQCKLELLQDPAMFAMLQDNLRGGVAMITKRHAEANNKYMGAQYDASKPSSYLMYLDANNLYGWAMSEPMPISDFRWLTEAEWSTIDWAQQSVDQETGYVVECDLAYPPELHQQHNDYPLAPERLTVTPVMLSEAQAALQEHYQFATKAKPTTKLIPNLLDKERYACHYRNLRYYLEHGLQLVKIHRVLAFRQSRWLAPYIEKNSQLRAAATSAFEKDFFKLLNNSVFGKTCENVTKRNDIRLLVDRAKCEALINKPHCLGFKIFSEDIAAVAMQKLVCLIEKPTYVGFCVLELSKLLMYQFHYDHAQKQWPDDRLRLMLTDTDSLVYEIRTEDVYEDIANTPELAACFDLSNYPTDSRFHSDANKMIIGKMKDEAGGRIITGVVGLRAKMYAYRLQEPECDLAIEPQPAEEKKRMKGIQGAAQKGIYYDDFVAQLHEPIANYICMRRIGHKLHNIFSIELSKKGLCAFDDKRYLLPDGVNTLAHGHIDTYQKFRNMFAQAEQTFAHAAEVRLRKAVLVAGAAPADARTHANDDVIANIDGENVLVLTHASAATRGLVPRMSLREALDTISGNDLRATFTAAHSRAHAALQAIAEEDQDDDNTLMTCGLHNVLAHTNLEY